MKNLTWKKTAGIVVGAVAIVVLLHSQPYRPIFNTSPSEPEGLYLLKHFGSHLPKVHLGELILFHYRAPAWAKGRYYHNGARFLKNIGAVPGEWLFTRGLHQEVCPTDHFSRKTCHVLGTMLTHDNKGRPLYWPHWSGYRIPAGKYYMQATYVYDSYDSRYYGLVNQSRFIGKLTPIFTWGN